MPDKYRLVDAGALWWDVQKRSFFVWTYAFCLMKSRYPDVQDALAAAKRAIMVQRATETVIEFEVP